MFDSILNLISSPQVKTTVEASSETHGVPNRDYSSKRTLASNSTQIEVDQLTLPISKNLSALSPVKLERENSMSNSNTSSSDISEANLSLYLKHNLDAVDLGDSLTQKLALQYLLEKVRDLESLMIDSEKNNKILREEVAVLYQQNDVLAAENVTLKDMITGHDDAKRILSVKCDELATKCDELTETLVTEKAWFEHVVKTNNKNIKDEFTRLKNFGDQVYDQIYDGVDDMRTNMMEMQAVAARNQIKLEIQQEDLFRLEKEIIVTNQYNRRQNLIIDGIPEDIPQHQLEQVCLDIIHEIGFLPVGSYEVVGCHRLRKNKGDTSTPTIIRFVNRKVTEFCLRNRWRLRKLNANWNWELSFREDLCEANQIVLNECENLKKDGKIFNVFTYNGFVKIVRSANARPIKIAHISELNDIIN